MQQQSSPPTVAYAVDGAVATIHLDRPDRLNAVNVALVDDLLTALRRAADEGARVVVLSGRGRAFCAGHDLKEELPPESVEQTTARLELIQDVTRLIRAYDGIVVAAVHGYALGAGAEFALACDLVVADEDATFGFPEVEVGLSVTGGVSRLLIPLVGLARAKDLMLLGERISGLRAAEIGLVARTAPPGRHEEVALELAARLASRPPTSLTLAKRVLDTGLDATIDEALAAEVHNAVITSTTGEFDQPRASQ
ncbi:MAG: paaF 1 [Nocardioidaceae bacterium]|nr:paaF 1 [Nocardioidaceae bacterium]